jgi:hypothetical protein
MGSYTVERSREEYDTAKPWKGWTFRYYFDERDEDRLPCESLEDGKRMAWEDWLERISPALVPVPDLETNELL